MRRLRKLASRQYGAFARRQAEAYGVGETQLRKMLRNGTIERGARSVYVFAGSVPCWRRRLMVAVLAAGPGAAVAGRAAAALLGFPGYSEGPVVVVQPRRPSRRYKVAEEHSSTYLPAHHVVVVDGIPTTTPERTVFDLCATAGAKRAEWLVKALVGKKMTTIGKLATVLAEMTTPGRPGVRMLRTTLASVDDGTPLDASELEKLAIAVLTSDGLPVPTREVEVGGTKAPVGRIDLLFRPARVVVEADSKAWHGEWLATEADHRRDKRLIAAGYLVIRTNWWELINEPELFVSAVRALLERATNPAA